MARTPTAKVRKEDDAPAVPRRNGQPRVLSRGDLRLLVLALIGEQPRHGYELIQHISGLFMQAYTPSAGTMYPLLASFEQAGWVASEEEDGRRVFRITAAGEFELKVQRTQVRLAQRRAFDRAREITKASLPPPLAAALREFKQALVRHHGRWSEGEAEAVAAQLSRASALLNGALGDGPYPVTPTEPD
ncbi:PadR family transcriptional regulator [Stenotrophomonas maltophilia]|uniref:PadR family transcriptional regulator n=1 Tax=Stenotrophomonas maltophilia TaxID=40324 RepID=UPI0009A19EB9|nr:PadR family transcriptional regulator [Stenotrophomonas maltophilia]